MTPRDRPWPTPRKTKGSGVKRRLARPQEAVLVHGVSRAWHLGVAISSRADETLVMMLEGVNDVRPGLPAEALGEPLTVPVGEGGCPNAPAGFCRFCASMALLTSVAVMPNLAILSGFTHTRME